MSCAVKPDQRRQLPSLRCDECDNGVEPAWDFCAWCGAPQNWKPAEPGSHDEAGK